MAAPFDFDGVQRRRDAELRHGRRIVAEGADDLASRVLAWASRAHAARTRLSIDDSEAAHAVQAWCRRRLKLDARRIVGRDAADSVRADVAELCASAFVEQLAALMPTAATDRAAE